MPTPPSRGIGVLWTSRSRTAVKAPVATARLRTKGVARYVTAAATMRTRTYSCTYRPSLDADAGKVTGSARVCREARHEVGDLRTHLLARRVVRVRVTLRDGPVDEGGDLLHLLDTHALGRDRRRADADA